MSAKKFGRRMHHEIRAELNRPAEIRRRKGVIDDQRNVMFVRNLRHGLNVQNIHARISDGFTVEELGLRRNGLSEVLRVVRIHKDRVNAHPAKTYVELSVSPTVERAGGNDLVA